MRTKIANLTICLLLFAGTLSLYGRTVHFDFIHFDDDSYVYENSHVKAGLSAGNIAWAFQTFAATNWHPMIWLSLMLDVDLFGLTPGWMHLENALLHATNSALLFVLLLRATGARWPSAWVAAMFAWHPLHVESVAWITERKDVLSTLFWMLCMLAYVRYVRTRARRDYWLSVAMLVIGLLCKSMLVTLPFVLLLMDGWPLRRTESLRTLVIEKTPMFVAILGSAVATFVAQSLGRSVAPIHKLPLSWRVTNSTVAYAIYLKQMCWPKGLAVFYPIAYLIPGGRIPASQILLSAAVLVFATVVAVMARKRHPWLLVGWLWYLGTLVPVIGLVQVGSQSHADRYAYIPSIGASIAVAWCFAAWAAKSKLVRSIACAIAGVTIIAACALTWRQIGYWRNTVTLMQHAIDVVPNNYTAHSSLGEAYDSLGDHVAATREYHAALAIRSDDAVSLYDLAVQALAAGNDDEAFSLLRQAMWADPNYGPAYNNYANLLLKRGRTEDAIKVYRAAIQRDPESAQPYHNLAFTLASTGNLTEAIDLWRQAIAVDPGYAQAHESLGNALIVRGQTREGITELKEALRLKPDRPGALKSLAWIYATHPSPLFQNAPEAQKLATRAVELEPDDAVAHDTLAAAYARAGKFDQAIESAQRAASLALAEQNVDLTKQIQKRLELYRSHQPFTSGR